MERPACRSPRAARAGTGRYAANARFPAGLAAPVVALPAPRPDERILDLGCGDGALTEQLAAVGCQVVGIDSGPAMVQVARARGLDARLMGGQALAFQPEFDAVFSNAALHWMRDPDAVIAGVRRALRPGGCFLGNVAALTVALVADLAAGGLDRAGAIPWYFPTAEAYALKLRSHSFAVDRVELIARPTPLPTDMRTGSRPSPARSSAGCLSSCGQAHDDVLALLAPCVCDERGCWTADYVRLHFGAHLSQA